MRMRNAASYARDWARGAMVLLACALAVLCAPVRAQAAAHSAAISVIFFIIFCVCYYSPRSWLVLSSSEKAFLFSEVIIEIEMRLSFSAPETLTRRKFRAWTKLEGTLK